MENQPAANRYNPYSATHGALPASGGGVDWPVFCCLMARTCTCRLCARLCVPTLALVPAWTFGRELSRAGCGGRCRGGPGRYGIARAIVGATRWPSLHGCASDHRRYSGYSSISQTGNSLADKVAHESKWL